MEVELSSNDATQRGVVQAQDGLAEMTMPQSISPLKRALTMVPRYFSMYFRLLVFDDSLRSSSDEEELSVEELVPLCLGFFLGWFSFTSSSSVSDVVSVMVLEPELRVESSSSVSDALCS